MYQLIAVICIFILNSCVTAEKTILSFHIGIGGASVVRLYELNLTSDKLGEEAKEEIQAHIDEFRENPKNGNEEMFDGCVNYKQDISYDEEGKLNAYRQGELEDIFMLFRLICMDDAHQLKPDNQFSYSWDGNLLKLGWTWDVDENKEEDADTPDDDWGPEVVITTDGAIESASFGTISQNKKKLTITGKDIVKHTNDGVFKIEFSGLAVLQPEQ